MKERRGRREGFSTTRSISEEVFVENFLEVESDESPVISLQEMVEAGTKSQPPKSHQISEEKRYKLNPSPQKKLSSKLIWDARVTCNRTNGPVGGVVF